MASKKSSNDKREKALVAAIDFGTTYSGYAFSFKHDFQVGKLNRLVFFTHTGYCCVVIRVSIVTFLSFRLLLVYVIVSIAQLLKS